MQQVPEEIERVMVGIQAYLSIRRRVSDVGVSVFEDIDAPDKATNEKVRSLYNLFLFCEFILACSVA